MTTPHPDDSTSAPAKSKRKANARAKVRPAKTLPKRVKPKEGERSGQFIRRVIKAGLNAGLTDRAFAEAVAAHYPGQRTTAKDIAWNRWDLKRRGEL